MLGEGVQHVTRDLGSVGPHDVFSSFLFGPLVVVPDGSVPAVFVHFFDFFNVVLREFVAGGWVFQEEGVLLVSGGMVLGHKDGVKVPEASLHELVGWHFFETKLKQELFEELPLLEQWVQMPAI